MRTLVIATILGAVVALIVLIVAAILGTTALDANHLKMTTIGIGPVRVYQFIPGRHGPSFSLGPGLLLVAGVLGVGNAIAARRLEAKAPGALTQRMR